MSLIIIDNMIQYTYILPPTTPRLNFGHICLPREDLHQRHGDVSRNAICEMFEVDQLRNAFQTGP